jgi:secondary thiamine-phosphate synthase enzyme
VSAYQEALEIRTPARGMVNVTREIARAVERSRIKTGICVVFVQHTSASLVIQENADPSVRRDLARWIDGLAPESECWEHDTEGPDDMPAHARAVMTRTSETIPVSEGRLALGTWQGVYLWEHRARSHVRSLLVHIHGEAS